MIDVELLDGVLRCIERAYDVQLSDVQEVAIEVAPDTATRGTLERLRKAGFNRINLGLQSLDSGELREVNRRFGSAATKTALETAMEVGFKNVCVDLIYGLKGQSHESWISSVEFALGCGPETICAYPLTLRPGTGLAKKSYEQINDSDQYRKWDQVNRRLLEAGYERQTHVRWARPGSGGYLQKQYHWACEPVVGMGAGARSYLWHLDIRNGYSLRKRAEALHRYLELIESGSSPIADGYLMDDDERMRKAIILGLQDLDTNVFVQRFGLRPEDAFPSEFRALADLELVEVADHRINLSECGVRYRDVAVQAFVSDRVRSLAGSFGYVE